MIGILIHRFEMLKRTHKYNPNKTIKLGENLCDSDKKLYILELYFRLISDYLGFEYLMFSPVILLKLQAVISRVTSFSTYASSFQLSLNIQFFSFFLTLASSLQ